MKKFILIILVLTSFSVFSQEDAWIYFTNKPEAATYLSNPLSMLTQRALDRRTNQNIPLDVKDVPIHQDYLNQILNANGITVKAKSKWLNAVHVRGTQSNIEALSLFSFVSFIDFANGNLNAKASNSSSSNVLNSINKNLDATIDYNYGTSGNQIQMLNGHLLHEQNFTGQGKIIAVLDSGFTGVNTAMPFQNLINNNQILGGYNFPDANSNYFARHFHGTYVLSCMGSVVENQLIGSAPNAQYYLFITEDVNEENPVEESYWVEAAELADYYGADIINTSLGYFGYDNPSYSYTYNDMNGTTSFISRGLNIAHSRGMIVVVSAGNSGTTANPNIGTPADALKAFTIGAVDSNENYVSFSSIGPTFDGRVKPDVVAKGLAATLSDINGTIITASGTSFSSPIMAGMVASFWSAMPNLTNDQVIQFIKESSDNFTNPTTQKGYGVPDFQLALNNALNLENVVDNHPVLYPNPVENEFTLLTNFTNTKLYIFNAIGQLVDEKEIMSKQGVYSLSNLNSGIYFYKIETSNKTFSGKIQKK